MLSSDAILLSGGNTYYFLNSLKKHRLLPILRHFVEKGGILIGVSAGSIIMAKTIAVTTIDEDIGGDQNTANLQDFSGLGLVDFEFFPHFTKDERITDRLKQYSLKNKLVIYACNDGDGIIVNGNQINFFGNVAKIQHGEITTAL